MKKTEWKNVIPIRDTLFASPNTSCMNCLQMLLELLKQR